MQLGLPFGDAGTPLSAGLLAPARERRDRDAEPPRVTPLPSVGEAIPVPPHSDALAPLYFVRHRRARRYLLRVDHDGRLRVTIPRGGSRREADAFARRHVAWVLRQRAHLSTSGFSIDERRALHARALVELPGRLRELAVEQGLAVSRISIRNQRTRWGSCGRDGHICLNWRLVVMPSWVRDYVMIHELMHLRRLDHSLAYWRLVAAACPKYRDARQWLRVHGPALR